METDMTPSEALRLSRAATLAEKHGEQERGHIRESRWIFTTEALAALIEEVTAPLRKELNDACLQAERDARDAYSQGEAAEADRHHPDY